MVVRATGRGKEVAFGGLGWGEMGVYCLASRNPVTENSHPSTSFHGFRRLHHHFTLPGAGGIISCL
jgi:hypothetical protein